MDTQVQQATLAVALGRHYLNHQTDPQGLDALIPSVLEALPDNPKGDTWRYAPSSDPSDYRLYSIEWHQSSMTAGNRPSAETVPEETLSGLARGLRIATQCPLPPSSTRSILKSALRFLHPPGPLSSRRCRGTRGHA
jgi:hypothetical protein